MFPTPRIILIDDNQAWLEALAEYLRRHGVVVFTANDPRRGLELLRANTINVVISDFNLPHMDGLQVLRNVRLLGGNVSVVLLTSEEEPGLEKKVLAEGASAFFSKTTEPAMLLRRLLEAIADLANSGRMPRALEIWQRLLPNPYSQAPQAAEPWQRLLPSPESRGPGGFVCVRKQPAA